jgi:hypothetical protein
LGELKGREVECAICLQELMKEDGGFVQIIVCGHIFHKNCLVEWIVDQHSCPLCRAILYTDEPARTEIDAEVWQ